MTYKKFTLLLMLVFILSYCGNNNASDEEPYQSDEFVSNEDSTSAEILEEDTEDIKDTIVLTPEQEELYKHGRDFYKWYITKQDSLFRKRERVLQLDSKSYFFIDLGKLKDYLDFLKTDGKDYISKNFIKKENEFWLNAKAELEKEPYLYEDGEAPYNFVADPIFFSQDWPTTFEDWQRDWRDIDKSSIRINGNSAVFWCDSKLKWRKENNQWKLEDWPE